MSVIADSPAAAASGFESVTLVCVETRHHALALEALVASQQVGRCARSLLLTEAATCPPEVRAQALAQGVELADIGAIASVAAYSRFMLESLVEHVASSHVLVVQWDGFVISPDAWDPAFLSFDYIGAVWPFAPPAWQVGNGGFSLRSRRLLAEVRERARGLSTAEPEDIVICRDLRDSLESSGMRFADPSTARRFSFELEPPAAGMPFGFHGLPNMHLVLPRQRLAPWLEALPMALMRQQEAVELGFRCQAGGRLDAARVVARRRLADGLGDLDTRELTLRCWSRTEPCWCGSGASFKRCHGRV